MRFGYLWNKNAIATNFNLNKKNFESDVCQRNNLESVKVDRVQVKISFKFQTKSELGIRMNKDKFERLMTKVRSFPRYRE